MKKLLLLAALICYAPLTLAKADITAGKEKAMICAACHSNDGNSPTGTWPKIAGQHAPYIVKQLQDFKKGETRNDPSMTGMVAGLTPQDMENIAAFYASNKVKLEAVKAKDVKLGERLYRAGDYKKGITACIACHGPQGTGNAEAGFPSLSGQHPLYTVTQLQHFKQGKRSNDLNSIMRDIAKRLDEKEMQAIADYVSALH